MAKKRTNYDRGREIEYKVVHLLKASVEPTYPFVARTAGSHGMFDVVAICDTHVLCVQVKRAKVATDFEKMYQEDLALIEGHTFAPNVQIEFWCWVDRKGFVIKKVLKQAM